jgi:hypothetical protein
MLRHTPKKPPLSIDAKPFADAFQKGDAKAVAAFWAEDGDNVDYITLGVRKFHSPKGFEICGVRWLNPSEPCI